VIFMCIYLPVLLSIGQSEPFTATSVIAEERGPA